MASDGIFTYRDGIAAAQVVAFSAPLLFAIYFRYTRRIGWFCIGVFSLLRLISASCKLAAINNDSRGLSAAIFVCESLGMILIIFLLLELLERINKKVTIVAKRIFWIPSIIAWIDIGISIGGWVSVTHAEHPLAPTPWSQASMALLAVIYIYLAGVFILFWLCKGEYFEEERWALTCVAFCLPLLAVRVAFSLIFVITGNMVFNAMKGNPTAYLMMTMLPEVAIIAACTYIITTKISPLSPANKKGQPKEGDEESQRQLSVGT